MSFRTKIFLFFSVIIVCLVASMIIFIEFSIRPSFKQQAINNFRVIAEENESTYFTFIEGLKKTTNDWSSDGNLKELTEKIINKDISPQGRARAVDDFSAYLREKKIKYDPSVFIVDLLDKNGIVVASSHTNRIGIDEGKEEMKSSVHYFSKALNAGLGESFVRSIVFEEDEAVDPMFHVTTHMFSANIDSRGNFIPLPAVLLLHFIPHSSFDVFSIAKISSSTIGALTSKGFIQSFDTSERYLVNKDHLLVTPTRIFSREDVVKKISIDTEPIDRCFKDGKEISKEYINYRGVSVLGISMCIKDQGVVIVSEIETQEAYMILDELVRKTIAGSGVVLFIVVTMIFLGSRRSLADLTRIINGAKRVSQGELSARIAVDSKDEIGNLANTLNTMLDTIKVSQDKLEATSTELYKKTILLKEDIEGHEKQEKFLEESKRAMQNLLEDVVQTKEKFQVESVRLQTTISSIADGLILLGGDYKIIMVNPKVVDFFAMKREEIEGKDLRHIMKLWRKKKDEVPLPEWPIEEMFLTGAVVTTDLEDDLYITTNNRDTYLPVSLSVAPLVFPHVSQGDTTSVSSVPTHTGGVVIIRDVTEDRELDNAKSGFISIASHQLRTPLTTIRWYSEMLLDEEIGALSPEQRDFLNEIHSGADRLYQTIDLLLGISRVESGKIKPNKIPINLSVFTTDVVKELAPALHEKKLSFSVIPPSGDPLIVSLDPITLRQVILNLFSNAIRYTNDGGSISAAWVLHDDGKVVYSVKDNGIGIPKSQQSRIFSKFFRAENAIKKVSDGSGLGLAFVKELVLAWGGDIHFDTVEGEGTTFTFTIPREGTKDK